MTVIVALKSAGKIIMGADSAGVAGYSLVVRADRKIYRVGEMLIGFTTSFRMGQLLGYKLKLPDHDPRTSVEKYMTTDFIDAVRQCLKDGGYATKDKEAEQGGTFIAAYRGGIYSIEGDYQVGIPDSNFWAVGCGFDLALGAFSATAAMAVEPKERVMLALHAAAQFSAGVRPPFFIEELG